MKTVTLKELRESVGITLGQAASHFHLKTPNTIRSWENGIRQPREPVYREKWITFLLDRLRLRNDQEKFFSIWQAYMVGQWGWRPITDKDAQCYYLQVPVDTRIILACAAQENIRVELTPRQHEVMQLLMDGKTNKEIAHHLKISVKHVGHMLAYSEDDPRSIYAKLDVHKNIEAIRVYRLRFPERCEPTELSAHNPTDLPPMDSQRQSSGYPVLTLAKSGWQTDKDMIFLTSYTSLYVGLIVFMYLPIWILGWKRDFANFYSGIYVLLPASVSVYRLAQLRKQKVTIAHPVCMMIKLLAIACILWATGGTIWMLLNLYGYEVPYPSAADYGYAMHYLIVPIGTYILYRATKQQHRQIGSGLVFISMQIAAFIGLVFLLLTLRHGVINQVSDPLKLTLDVGYPAMDTLSICLMTQIAYFTSSDTFDPSSHIGLRTIHAGMAILFIADCLFSIGTTVATTNSFGYYNGGLNDFLYASAFFVTGVGMVKTHPSSTLRLKLRGTVIRLITAFSLRWLRKWNRWRWTLSPMRT